MTSKEALEAKLAEVEAERDAFASNIPDAAQNLIRNAHTGRLKALHRAVVAEARTAHLENHIEGVAKDTHSTMLQYEAALPAVYRLGLADAADVAEYAGAVRMQSDGSYSHHEAVMGPTVACDVLALPTPTAAELMARIQEGETDNGMA